MENFLGNFMASALHHKDPRDLATIKAATEAVDGNFEDLGRFTATMAYNMLRLTGHEKTGACQYMKLLAERDEWDPAFNEPCYIVLELVDKHAALREKQSVGLPGLGALAAAMGTTTQMLGVLALLGGMGVGGAAWSVNRHKDTDAIDNEKLQAQIGVYQDLSDETQSKLQQKYKFNEQSQAQAG